MFSVLQERDAVLKSALPGLIISVFLLVLQIHWLTVLAYAVQSIIWYGLLFYVIRIICSTILPRQYHTPLDAPLEPSRCILSCCIFNLLCLTLGTMLSLRIGWIGGFIVALICNVILIGLSLRYGSYLRKTLDQIENFSHPYSEWVIVVSRRFSNPELDDSYKTQILPILEAEGIVIECLYASEEYQNIDYWINRMLMMFEIADFHILIEHDPSSATQLEQVLSYITTYHGRKTAIVGLLGYIQLGKDQTENVKLHWLIGLAGMVLCFLWYRLVKSYHDINSGKFKVIHEIEKRLPLAPYDAEWEMLGRGKNPKLYRPFTHIETGVPWVFFTLHLFVLIRVLLNML